jgi:hypothetical protein
MHMDKNPKNNWTLREALYTIFHNWPTLLACIIIGSLLGWGLSYIWSSYYRASSDIYIGLNPYRKFSDTNFEALANPKYSNLDNYHYWQMSQLNSAITMDIYLEPTLDRLRQADPYWQTVDVAQLRGMLGTEWRSSGTWSLIANHPNSRFAQQAARAWSDVVVEQVPQAVTAARETFQIDQKLQSNEDAILQATLRQRELSAAQKDLLEWQKTAQNTPSDSAVAPTQRWQLLATITRLADFSPVWMNVLQGQPESDAKAQAYLDWIDQTLPVLEDEAATMRQRVIYLNQQQIDLATQYAQESQKSLSFSPNIEIQRKEDIKPLKMRPTSTLILVGGVTGLLIGLLLQLVIITKARSRQ